MKRNAASRPLTEDTRFLIAVYTHRGDTVWQIAFILDRPWQEVFNLLEEMQKSGEYERHIRRYENYQHRWR